MGGANYQADNAAFICLRLKDGPGSTRAAIRRTPGSAFPEARPAHAGPHRKARRSRWLIRRGGRYCTGHLARRTIIALAATASRTLPAVASHAIGCADPGPGGHPPGFGAYRGRWGTSRLRAQAPGMVRYSLAGRPRVGWARCPRRCVLGRTPDPSTVKPMACPSLTAEQDHVAGGRVEGHRCAPPGRRVGRGRLLGPS